MVMVTRDLICTNMLIIYDRLWGSPLVSPCFQVLADGLVNSSPSSGPENKDNVVNHADSKKRPTISFGGK